MLDLNKKAQNSRFSDAEIIAALKKGGIDRQRMTTYLYRQYAGFIKKGIRKYSLTEEDSVDAFGDALIGLCSRISQDSFQLDGNLVGYLYRSFCNRCVDRVRKNSSSIIEQVELMPHMRLESKNILKRLIQQETFRHIEQLLDILGPNCKQMLIESEYYGYSVEELAQRMGFKNARSLSSQKYRCMAKLRDLLAKSRIKFS